MEAGFIDACRAPVDLGPLDLHTGKNRSGGNIQVSVLDRMPGVVLKNNLEAVFSQKRYDGVGFHTDFESASGSFKHAILKVFLDQARSLQAVASLENDHRQNYQ